MVVPNNFFADYALINFSEMNYRRIFWQIGVEYQTSSDQLRDICGKIKNWLEDNPNFISDDRVPCLIFVDGFNDSSIDIMVYCFTETTDWQEWLTQKQDLAYAIKEIVEGVGTGFAFPAARFITRRAVCRLPKFSSRPKDKRILIVVGGGIIGATTAHACLRRGHEVTLLEAGDALAGAQVMPMADRLP